MNNTRKATAKVNGILRDIFNQLHDKIRVMISEEQTEVDNTKQVADTDASDNIASNEKVSDEKISNEENSSQEASGNESAEEDSATKIVISKGNLVDVDVIDLFLHAETTGNFTPVYAYENPFKGKDTSKGQLLNFMQTPHGRYMY